MGGLLLLLLAILVLYGVKIWRRIAPVFARERELPRVAYRTVLDVLAEAGFSRHYGETREAFAKRVAAVAPSFAAATDMHLAARLGDPAHAPNTRGEFDKNAWREVMARAKSEIAARAKWWRRLLGLIHPAAFMDSR
jgi:hypothetical protein